MADLASVVATSLRNSGKTLYDQIFDSHPIWSWFKSHDRFVPYNGGIGITEDVVMAANSNVAARDPKAAITIAEQDPFRQVMWREASITGSVPIYYADERKNAQRLVDFAKSLVANLRDSMTDTVAKQLWEDGLAADGVTPTLQGLPKIISASNTYGTIVLEDSYVTIDRSLAANSWWRSWIGSTSEVLAITGGADGGLRNLVDQCKNGKQQEQPDLIATTLTLWQKYDGLLLPNQRYENPKLAEAGFRNLMFDGAACVWDANCPAGEVNAINSKWIKVRPDQPCAEQPVITDPRELPDRLGKVILAIWTGQIVCTGPRYQGKLTAKTVS